MAIPYQVFFSVSHLRSVTPGACSSKKQPTDQGAENSGMETFTEGEPDVIQKQQVPKAKKGVVKAFQLHPTNGATDCNQEPK